MLDINLILSEEMLGIGNIIFDIFSLFISNFVFFFGVVVILFLVINIVI